MQITNHGNNLSLRMDLRNRENRYVPITEDEKKALLKMVPLSYKRDVYTMDYRIECYAKSNARYTIKAEKEGFFTVIKTGSCNEQEIQIWEAKI